MNVSGSTFYRKQPTLKYKFNIKHQRLEYLDLAKTKATEDDFIFSNYTDKCFGTNYLLIYWV